MTIEAILSILVVATTIFFEWDSRHGPSKAFPKRASNLPPCKLYLGPSTIPGAGRGIVAGVGFDKDDEIEHSVVLPLKQSDNSQMQLNYYTFATGDPEYTMIVIGPGQLVNSMPNKNTKHQWVDRDDDVQAPNITAMQAYSTFSRTKWYAKRKIKPGDEIFFFYGADWFLTHDFDVDEDGFPITVSTEDEQSIRGQSICLTDVELSLSTIQLAGKGLFASRRFKKGELITISPVATIPKSVVENTRNSSLLMNYCMARPDSDMVLFQMSYPAMLNHNATLANVHLDWFFWKYLPKERRFDKSALKMTIEDLMELPYAPLDLGYYATRDIEEGEELFLDYGTLWEISWRQFLDNHPQCRLPAYVHQDPICGTFRSFIAIPNYLYPSHWKHK